MPDQNFTYEGPPTYIGVAAGSSSVETRQLWPKRIASLPTELPWVYRLSGPRKSGRTKLTSTSATNTPPNLSPIADLNLTVNGNPYAITPTNIGGRVGVTYTATGLPAGWSINSLSGVITGTIDAALTATITITATNDGGDSAASFALTIAPGTTPQTDFDAPVATIESVLIPITPSTGALSQLSASQSYEQPLAGQSNAAGLRDTVTNWMTANMVATTELAFIGAGGTGFETTAGFSRWAVESNDLAADLAADLYTRRATSFEGDLIGALIWAQGEREAQPDGIASNYLANAVALKAYIASEAGINLPWVVVRLSTNASLPQKEIVRTAQEQWAANDPDVYLVDADALPLEDASHYTEAGYAALFDLCREVIESNGLIYTYDELVPISTPSSGTIDFAATQAIPADWFPTGDISFVPDGVEINAAKTNNNGWASIVDGQLLASNRFDFTSGKSVQVRFTTESDSSSTIVALGVIGENEVGRWRDPDNPVTGVFLAVGNRLVYRGQEAASGSLGGSWANKDMRLTFTRNASDVTVVLEEFLSGAYVNLFTYVDTSPAPTLGEGSRLFFDASRTSLIIKEVTY